MKKDVTKFTKGEVLHFRIDENGQLWAMPKMEHKPKEGPYLTVTKIDYKAGKITLG